MMALQESRQPGNLIRNFFKFLFVLYKSTEVHTQCTGGFIVNSLVPAWLPLYQHWDPRVFPYSILRCSTLSQARQNSAEVLNGRMWLCITETSAW